MLSSLPGEEFYEASPYEPVTSRLSDIFRLASIFSGKWPLLGRGPGALGLDAGVPGSPGWAPHQHVPHCP